MSEFKERAALKTQGLKTLLLEKEKERDALLDEIAHRKGQAFQIEKTIKRLYEIIVDLNKEEQNKEAEALARQVQSQPLPESVEAPKEKVRETKRNKK